MIATIDKAGRLVIPKAIREKMGLKPGVPLNIDFVEGKIEIDYVPVEARMRIAEDGLPIIETDADFDLTHLGDDFIREAREETYRERDARWV